jgi:hypothetical protein
MTQTIDQRVRELLAKHVKSDIMKAHLQAGGDGFLINADEARAALTEALTRIQELEGALKPFETVGKIIDGPFGPALFAEDGMAFSSGCAWTENGEKKMLTWGNFRRAAVVMGANLNQDAS